MSFEQPSTPSPEEMEKIEAERLRVSEEAGKETDLRNEGLSPRKKTSGGPEEDASSVMQGDAIEENRQRDYQEATGKEVQHDYPGNIEEMERAIDQGIRYDMDVFLFAHRSAETNDKKTKVYELYKKQGVNPFEGGSRAKTAEIVGLQREVDERTGK